MKRIRNVGIYFIITLFFISMGTASAADITVNNSTGPVADFTSIQAAVDAAKDGDTIIVYSGIYTEHVDVNKELTILSQSGNPEDTVVRLPYTEDDVFLVTSNNVTINGLKIIGHTYNCMGIHFLRVQYNNVSNNFFVGAPIWFISSDNNLLINNKITDCNIGLSYSSNNMMAGNTISTFTDCFMFEDFCSNNTVSNNSMDGRAGVRTLEFCNNNTIKDNYINAFERSIVTTESNNNVIYNNFFDGTVNVYDDGNNIWNITKTPGINIVGGPFLGGNYWSDYEGIDTDEDGLGDTLLPHNSSEIANGGDYLPLVSPESPPPITYITVNNSAGPVADYTSIQAAVDAAKDGDNILVYSGIYTENVDVNKELKIISQSENPDDTIVQALNEDNIFNVTADNVSIRGFTIQNAPLPYSGISVSKVNNSLISNNKLTNNRVGITLRNEPFFIKSGANNVIKENTCSNNDFGIVVETENNIISDNDVSNNHYGINIGNSNNTVERNYLYKNSDVGISFQGGDHNLLRGNSVLYSREGIYLLSSHNNKLDHNTVYSNGRYGILLYGSSNNILSHNIAYKNSIEDIRLYSSNNNLLIDNVIRGHQNAICINSSSNNTVSYNKVRESSYGINLGSSNNNIVNNNDVDVHYNGIDLKSSSNNIVNNNDVDVYYNGIDLKSSSSNIMCNNTVNSYYTCFELSDSNNNTLKNNIANGDNYGQVGLSSFRLFNSSYNTLIGNIAWHNGFKEGWENINFNNSNSNLIYDNYFNGTNNAYDDGNNIWNITKTPGTNIVGGPFLGGNYWSDYAGVDYNGDGLGDTLLPYNCEGQIANGGDYLPLVIPGGPIPPIPATVDINPGVLNLNNSGGWITAYIELPEGCDVNDIEVSTILLMESIPAESSPLRVGDYDADGILDLMVKFDKKELIPLLEPGDVELTVTGELIDGSVFEGTDTIQVNS